MKASKRAGKRFAGPAALFMVFLGLLGCDLARGQGIPLPGQTTLPLPGQAPGAGGGRAGLGLKWGGYLENTVNAEQMRYDGSTHFLNNTRVRLNLGGVLSPLADFGLAAVAEANSGDRKYFLTRYLPEKTEAKIAPAHRDLFVDELGCTDTYFQEAFLTFTVSFASLRVGRHKFYSGTGYAYNPIDLFNAKSPLDPTYETRGQDAAILSLELPWSAELELTARTGEDHRHLDSQARLKYDLDGWDLALQYTRCNKRRWDWASNGRGIDFTWNLAAAEFSGEIAGVGLHGEGGYVAIDEPDDAGTLTRAGMDHERLLIGADYTFECQLYLLLEYLRFGQGRGDPDGMTLADRFAYMAGEIITANRDTFYLGMRYPLTGLLEVALYSIVHCNDPGATVSPWLEWDLRPGWKLSLVANIPAGGEKGSDGRMGASGFARLRYSF